MCTLHRWLEWDFTEHVHTHTGTHAHTQGKLPLTAHTSSHSHQALSSMTSLANSEEKLRLRDGERTLRTRDIEVMQDPGYIWVGVGEHRRWNLLHFLGNLQVSTENPSYRGQVIRDFLCPLTVLNYCKKKFILINFNFRTVLH